MLGPHQQRYNLLQQKSENYMYFFMGGVCAIEMFTEGLAMLVEGR